LENPDGTDFRKWILVIRIREYETITVNRSGDTATEREGWKHDVDRMDTPSDGRNHRIIMKMRKDKETLAGEFFRFIQGLNCL
jgi:hypothetical protein